MSSSAGAMLAREEENDNEVRREDQENINKFGRLNARLYEARDEQAALKVRRCYCTIHDIFECYGGIVTSLKEVMAANISL